MIAPYGRHQHARGMQVFGKRDAETLVNEFNRPLNVIARKMGLPWYIGHPDHPYFVNRYLDTRAYGRIRKLAAKADGLWGEVFFNKRGRRLVGERAFHGHSPNWAVAKAGGAFRPIALRSVGFTNMPNIPVEPILHANEKNQKNSLAGGTGPGDQQQKTKNKTMIRKIRDLLLALGKLKPESTEDDTLAGVQALANENQELREGAVSLKGEARKLGDLANDLLGRWGSRLQSALEARNGEAGEDGEKLTVAQLANEAGLDEATMEAVLAGDVGGGSGGRLDALAGLLGLEADALLANEAMSYAAENFAAERRARSGLLVDRAIEAGRLVVAERDAKVEELANSADFDAAAAALEQARPVLKTKSSAVGLGDRNPDNEGKTLVELANEMAGDDSPAAFDAAWARLKKEKPELFDGGN